MEKHQFYFLYPTQGHWRAQETREQELMMKTKIEGETQ